MGRDAMAGPAGGGLEVGIGGLEAGDIPDEPPPQLTHRVSRMQQTDLIPSELKK